MGVSKNSGFYSKSSIKGFSLFSPYILGYPYFWKHPHIFKQFQLKFLANKLLTSFVLRRNWAGSRQFDVKPGGAKKAKLNIRQEKNGNVWGTERSCFRWFRNGWLGRNWGEVCLPYKSLVKNPGHFVKCWQVHRVRHVYMYFFLFLSLSLYIFWRFREDLFLTINACSNSGTVNHLGVLAHLLRMIMHGT